MDNLEVEPQNRDSLGCLMVTIFRPYDQAKLTARRLLHNVLEAQFPEKESNRRLFENGIYEQLVRDVREVGSKSFLKFKMFSWNIRHLAVTAESNWAKLIYVNRQSFTLKTLNKCNFSPDEYKPGKYKSNIVIISLVFVTLSPILFKDIRRKKAPSNKTPMLSKRIRIWTFGWSVHQINSLYEVLKLKQNFWKNKVVTDKTPFFVIGLFWTFHSNCLNIGFWHCNFAWKLCVFNLSTFS